MKIFLIPGLGYDNRIFQNIDFGEFDVEYLNWIEPLKNENISDYSKRLFTNWYNESEKIIIIGHSLGGIVAQEIAKIYRIEKVMLIASIKSEKENPMHFKIFKYYGLNKIFTKEVCIWTVKFWGKNHGFETPKDKELFKNMLSRHTNTYLQWALKELAIWKSFNFPDITRLIQISGEKDKSFPIKLINNPTYKIEGGNHIMLYKQADKINKIVIDELKKGV